LHRKRFDLVREFLDYKIVIGTTNSDQEARKNKQILWWSFCFHNYKNEATPQEFMENVDTAVVYHNASTRLLMAANLA
jgi:glutamate-5-semialdehyde dehydrogenase